MRFKSCLALLAISAFAQTPPAWVAKSNQNAQLLINIDAKYSPESAASDGVMGLDAEITVPDEARAHARRDETRVVMKELQSRLATETDPAVKQDLEILIGAADRRIRSSEIYEKVFLPYDNPGSTIFFGVKSLLDDQIAADRHPAALVRLKKYTGLTPGFTPFTTILERQYRAKLTTPGLLGPSKIEVEKDLGNTSAYVNGIGLLLEKYKLQGYGDAFTKLKEQLAEYDTFIRAEVLPKSRSDFRLPPAVYTLQLERYGVDYTSVELTRFAHQSFTDIQKEMRPIAIRIAKARHLPASDYRSVIAALKKEQLDGDKILPHYLARLTEIEEIVRKNHLVTLPDRPAMIRIATAAETAQQPAPHMQPAPLLNNHGERGAFVLPLETTGTGGAALKYDDFTFAAASWTLTAHEARPGHELQFDAMIEHGVSLARAMFAFNSTNAEGWGLYSEWYMLPYMPDEGKLISLQFRMLRAARAFLDPELQQGKITPDQAMQILERDVVCSKAFATEEVERFTFRSPGQAVSYFDGMMRLLEIRHAAEKAMGSKFDAGKFHDFILSQGLLPPSLLRKAVMTDFVRN